MGCTCTTQKPKKGGSQPGRQQAYEVSGDQKQVQAQVVQPQREVKKLNKKQQQLAIEVLKIYAHPEEIAKLAFKDVPEFIKTIKKYKLQNLAPFIGYEADPAVVLQSSKSVNTYYWNPFTVALVLGKGDLYSFIIKEMNFNMRRLLELEQAHVADLGENNKPEEKEFESIMETFNLMIENNSELLKNVLNDLSHLIRNQHLKRLLQIILRQPQKAKYLEIVLSSRPFRTMFLQKVKTLSGIKYKSSFNNFYETLLSKFEQDEDSVKVMAKVLSQAPFNVSFMVFLIQDYKKKKSVFDTFITHDLSFKGYDIHRIGFTQRNATDLQKLVEASDYQKKPYFMKFVDLTFRKLLKMENNEKKIETKVQEMFEKIQKGDLSGFKSKITSFPKEDLSFITGAKLPDITIEITSLKKTIQIQTQGLNALQLACAYGHTKIVNYLIDECQLKSAKDFQRGRNYLIDDQFYLLAPLFLKDVFNFPQLLSLSHLWTYDDIQNMLILLKQIKWFQGFNIVLESKSCQEIFFNRSLQDRFRFIRDFLIIPFKIDYQPGSSGSLLEDEGLPSLRNSQRSQRNAFSDSRNVLSDKEKRDLRAIIKTRLCQYPYTGAFIFQEFAPRRDTYREVAEEQVLPDDSSERLVQLTTCLNNLEDIDLHDYIQTTQGGVLTVVQRHLQYEEESEGMRNVNQNESYKAELRNLIERIENHPTYAQYIIQVPLDNQV